MASETQNMNIPERLSKTHSLRYIWYSWLWEFHVCSRRYFQTTFL